MIPVTLLTGFLGSGKTTVLNHLVRQPALADALVIINEFGEMPLDHLLVAHSTENLAMEMSSGCLCCSIRGDLVKTLRDIPWRFSREGKRQFGRVLIETTGLADPAPIIHTLMTHPHIAPKYRLDGILTTIDLSMGMQTLGDHEEAVKQAAVADVLLLTKADLVTQDKRSALLRRLATLNPTATRWEPREGEIEAEKLLNLGFFSAEGKTPDVARWIEDEAVAAETPHAHGFDHDERDVNRHNDRVRAHSFALENPISPDMLASWLEELKGFLSSNILRFKGILNIEGREAPIAVHGVQHAFYPPVTLPAWPNEDRRARLVFITQDVDRKEIESAFPVLLKHNAHKKMRLRRMTPPLLQADKA